MTPRYKESGTPHGCDYVIGIIVIFGFTISGIIIFGLDWEFGGGDAIVIWFCLDVFLLISLGSIIRGSYKLGFKRAQTHRDKLAARVVRDKSKEFFLYLRPFSSTGRLPFTLHEAEHYVHSPGSLPKTYFESRITDLETELAKALEMCAPLIALGQPGEHVGAGRIKIEDEKWESMFIDLASRAIAIFVVPATTKGTQWELDRLANRVALRRKTLLIIPPQTIDKDGNPIQDIREPRLDAIEALTAHGIFQADIDSRDGLIIRYNATSISVPIATYNTHTPATERGLLGWYHNLGPGTVKSRHLRMESGLRNAIFSIEPRLAEWQEIENRKARKKVVKKEIKHKTQERATKEEVKSMYEGELKEILEQHKKWIDTNKEEGKKAELKEADLHGADLQGADLASADLQGTDLQGAELQGADLQGAELQGADLKGAELQGAELKGADLKEADLTKAILWGANLQDANLEEAILWGAYLQGANLQDADLKEAKLQGAYLRGAYLQGTDLFEARGLTVKQLSVTKTLYKAKLDPELMEQIKNKYPHLLEKPKAEEKEK